MRQAVDFRARKQKCAGTKDITRSSREIAGRCADRLNASQPSILINMRQESLPSLLDHRAIFSRIQNAGVNSPRESISEKSGAGVFRELISVCVQQTGTPKTVRALQRSNLLRHLAELRDVLRAPGIVLRHLRQHASQSGKNPSIAPRPEDPLSIGLVLVEERLVAKKEMVRRTVKQMRGNPPFMVHKVQILAIPGRPA